MLDILSWTMVLYQLIGDTESAYNTSLQIGDVLFAYGKQFLTGSHLIGKEEKWERGLQLYNNAIDVYQQVRLDTPALDKIFALWLDKIARLIDIFDFPTPPFPLVTVITLATLLEEVCSLSGTVCSFIIFLKFSA